MKTVQRKWWWVWDFDREEAWLNEMAARGMLLCGVGFCRYEFEECEPGEYTVRLELMEHQPESDEGKDYIGFLEETGAEYIGSYIRWGYFRKKTAEGSFDIHSDLDSRIRHLGRIEKMVGVVGLVNILLGISNLRYNHLGLINLALGALLLYGYWRLRKKSRRLEAERQIFE